ncbi:hypothetical protein KGF57_001311 [Candida theae]|uniref:Uncharacterized protein n=1 Tax=Candida theae TaxID=1198502 RepID=A0AAD5G009_9ASCO|nr:uncharacterized protein KGF57_001311 [Candida theae]KAI5963366.1 hypothetical protein KGF57_001311 [Candida theae]
MSLKSSSFTNSATPTKRFSSKFNATVTRSRSSTPFPNGAATSTKSIDAVAGVNSRPSKSYINTTMDWKLEDISEEYVLRGTLPPPLSPTIPQLQIPVASNPTNQVKSSSTQDKEESLSYTEHKLLISTPFEPGLSQEEVLSPEREATSHLDPTLQHMPSKRLARGARYSRDCKDKASGDETLRPLSPTLPDSFNNEGSYTKSLSKERSSQRLESKRGVSAKKGQTSATAPIFRNVQTDVGVFKWINKVNDLAKPKFLLRVTMSNKMKFKESVAALSKSSNVTADESIALGHANTRVGDTVQHAGRSSMVEVYKKGNAVDSSEDLQYNSKEKESTPTEIPPEVDTKSHKSSEDKQQNEKEIEKLVKIIEEKQQQLREKSKQIKGLECEIKSLRAKHDLGRKQTLPGAFVNDLSGFEQSSSVEFKLTKDQVEDVKAKLITKKKYWSDICKNVQNDIDIMWKALESTRGTFPDNWKAPQIECRDIQVIVMQIDVFIMKMVSLDYDERSKVVTDTLPSERSWKALDKDIEGLITYIGLLLSVRDDWSATENGHFELEFLRTIKCLMFQTRALVTKRINSILSKVVVTYIEKMSLPRDETTSTLAYFGDSSLSNKVIELQQSSIKNAESARLYFMNSQPEFLDSMLQSTFSCVWEKRTLNLAQVQQSYNLEAFDRSIKPSLQIYYLPLGIYSNLNEVNSILFNVTVYFLETYNKLHQNKSINYKLQSGQT